MLTDHHAAGGELGMSHGLAAELTAPRVRSFHEADGTHPLVYLVVVLLIVGVVLPAHARLLGYTDQSAIDTAHAQIHRNADSRHIILRRAEIDLSHRTPLGTRGNAETNLILARLGHWRQLDGEVVLADDIELVSLQIVPIA